MKSPVKKISRSKLELLTECPRCFWLDLKHGIKRPPPAPYTINSAIDYLLKQEFDIHREKGTPHPIMERHEVIAVPFAHEKMGHWRHNFTGVQYQHEPSGFLVFGAVDDIWVNPEGELIVVDYKATGANQHRIYDSYRRQLEIYQWLVRNNGFKVSPVGYFVFARVKKAGGFSGSHNGNTEQVASLAFDIFVESQEGDDSWVEGTVMEARRVYDLEKSPEPSSECEHCVYVRGAGEH